MSNVSKMTLEEKLVQNIKDSTLGSLIDDEDAVIELTKRAFSEALYQKRRIPDPNRGGYNLTATIEVDSPVVEAARKVADKALNALFEEQFKEIFDNPDIKKAIQEAIVMLLPGILCGFGNRIADSTAYNMQAAACNRISEAFINAGMKPPVFNHNLMTNFAPLFK